MLSSIVIANREYFTMFITCNSHKVRGIQYVYGRELRTTIPMASGFLLPEGPARESICPSLLPAISLFVCPLQYECMYDDSRFQSRLPSIRQTSFGMRAP